MPYLRLGILIGLLMSTWVQARVPAKILVLGDSISAAYGMNIEQGWVSLWAESVQDRAHIINASMSGETSTGGLSRLPLLLEQHEPALVIIELGGNDGLRGYPIKQLKNNLLAMVQLSQASGARVALIPMQIPPNYGAAYTKKFFQTFSEVVAQSESSLLPFFLEPVALNPELMQADGIHPTAEAQPLMLATLEQALSQLLETLAEHSP